MNALLWFLGIIFGFYLFFSLFGRLLLKMGFRFLAKKAAQSMQQQSRQYEDTFSSTPFEEKINTPSGEQVVIKKEEKPKPPKSAFGKVVDFEEEG